MITHLPLAQCTTQQPTSERVTSQHSETCRNIARRCPVIRLFKILTLSQVFRIITRKSTPSVY
jgi:hypothetical protein